MIVGLLICAISIIPIVLAVSVNRIYKNSQLSQGLLLFMILISVWQGSIGVLYFEKFLTEDVALFLFRLLRLAPTYQILVTFYIVYVIINHYSVSFRTDMIIDKILSFVFTKQMLVMLIIWSSLVYLVNWTTLGIEGLKVSHSTLSPIEFYFPEYGKLSWLYIFHMGIFILFLCFLFLVSNKIHNEYVKGFLKSFTLYSLFLFLTGLFNFIPETGVIAGSLGVIIFSVMIILEFVKLNTAITLHNYQLVERQKKLDYTGNLAGSLIHEVKNTNQIIKGFSQIFKENSTSLTSIEMGSLEMISNASDQLDDLTSNYREFIKNSKIEFKSADIDLTITKSIEFSRNFIEEKQIEIEFINHFKPLKAMINQTYFQQVFINLIKNSSEAITSEQENKKITISTDIDNDYIIINFCDTGRGIPPENWESIFDLFISSKSTGMGLGLPFVKKIMFEHRGDIKVIDSTPAGTHFQIKLPQFSVINSELSN